MVGDGVSDAPALVQYRLGAGTDVAMESAGVVLVSDRIDRVLSAILLGRASHAKMKQNIAFAVLFNLVGMGLAVLLPHDGREPGAGVPVVDESGRCCGMVGRHRHPRSKAADSGRG